jgi:hypothetical protein
MATGIIFSLFTVIKGYTNRVDVLPVIFRARSAAERAAGVARGLSNRPRPPDPQFARARSLRLKHQLK